MKKLGVALALMGVILLSGCSKVTVPEWDTQAYHMVGEYDPTTGILYTVDSNGREDVWDGVNYSTMFDTNLFYEEIERAKQSKSTVPVECEIYTQGTYSIEDDVPYIHYGICNDILYDYWGNVIIKDDIVIVD